MRKCERKQPTQCGTWPVQAACEVQGLFTKEDLTERGWVAPGIRQVSRREGQEWIPGAMKNTLE